MDAISNNEVGSSVRTKLNLLITEYNTQTAVKRYRALINQSGSSAPVATVLENTLGGTVVWARSGAGDYNGTLTGAFPGSKVLIFCQLRDTSLGNYSVGLSQSTNSVGITTAASGSPSDGILDDANLEILVFP